MGAGFSPVDALPYVAGVDRSPTEVAALFLADVPDGDAVRFLVEALELAEADAALAVSWLELAPSPAAAPVVEDEQPAAGVELTAEGLASLSHKQLKAIAIEAGITPGRKGFDELAAEILEVVAFADLVEAQEG